ncbi:hypothetical protein [Streptomyces sp. P9(2023)]|uniref:hypothetical protein n=1 Tax=Streptomyces sp. P9(2023) TaxID=3064394 RepID=UPI0028F3E287|nr:hypothetical protein [Streptomyces sp. P9(2023)]
MPSFDTRVPAVLVRLDRNPFHHGTLGAARSLGRAGVPVHAVLESLTGPAARSRYLRIVHVRPAPLSPSALPAALADLLLRLSAGLATPALLVPRGAARGCCGRAATWTGSSTGTPTPPGAVPPGPPAARSGRGRTARGSRPSALDGEPGGGADGR